MKKAFAVFALLFLSITTAYSAEPPKCAAFFKGHDKKDREFVYFFKSSDCEKAIISGLKKCKNGKECTLYKTIRSNECHRFVTHNTFGQKFDIKICIK